MPRALRQGPRIPDADFVAMVRELGPSETAKRLNLAERNVYDRRVRLERKYKIAIEVPQGRLDVPRPEEYPQRVFLKVKDGVVLIGSDAHYWPGIVSTAHKAFVKFCKEMKPAAVVMNGDVLDGATISRHLPIGWEKRPSVIEEIETCKDRLGEITIAAGKARRVWPLGNHDARFETRLASAAPEYARVQGVHLSDHFSDWEKCWAVWINDHVVIKHRFKSGVHAPHNNTVNAGKTLVTGHLHSLKVQPFSDYNGTRFGVDCGTLADAYGVQFTDYMEDNPRSWRSGFIVLTFKDSRLLWPEVVHVTGPGEVDFRGKLISV